MVRRLASSLAGFTRRLPAAVDRVGTSRSGPRASVARKARHRHRGETGEGSPPARHARYSERESRAQLSQVSRARMPAHSGSSQTLIKPAFASIAQFRTPGKDVIHAGGKGRLRSNKKAEPARFLDGAHPAEQLRRVAIGAAPGRVRGSIDGFLPQRGIDISRRYRIDAHLVDGFIDGER